MQAQYSPDIAAKAKIFTDYGRSLVPDTALDIAGDYLSRGWNPVPVGFREKKPHGNEWHNVVITDDNIGDYFFSKAKSNVGVQLGPKSGGLTDIDLDCAEAIVLAEKFLPPTGSYFGRESKPTSHFLYYMNGAPDRGGIKHLDADGRSIVELRMGGGTKGTQTVFPGSTHECGESIEWNHNGEPAKSTFAELNTAITKIAVATILIRAFPAKGSRHDAALAIGGFLARAGWDKNDIRAFVEIVAKAGRCDDPEGRAKDAVDAAESYASGKKVYGFPGLSEFFGEDAAEAIAKIIDYGETPRQQATTNATAPAFSEEALALLFGDRHANELRHVAMWNKWLRYVSGKWEFDETLKTFSLARDLCREVAVTANKSSIAKTIAGAKTRANVISLAREDRRLAATIDQWDRDRWLLNTPGGVVDLRTGQLREHRADDYMTKVTAVTPLGDCPKWKAFLHKITGENVELERYICRMLGYALTGVTIEHALFFLYGTGGNGKGVLVDTVAGIFADYHKTANQETFTVNSNEQHSTELAMLRGARLVTVTETEAGKRWAESRIKTLTGGDRINARFMRQDFFEFLPQFKLVISGNHKPGLNSVNEAMRRRVNMLPFNITISEAERDMNLAEKLKAEWPGILAWMIQGCLEWQRDGLSPPKIVTEATEEYMATEDKLGRWISECCELVANGWAGSTDLYRSWQQWTVANGEWTGSQTKLSIELRERGFKPEATRTANGFAGLKIVPFHEDANKEPQ